MNQLFTSGDKKIKKLNIMCEHSLDCGSEIKSYKKCFTDNWGNVNIDYIILLNEFFIFLDIINL